MDNFKLYANSEQHIGSLIHIIGIYSKEFGTSFWLDKCGCKVAKGGKVNQKLSEGKYKYLGTPQANGNHDRDVWRSATVKYLI